MKTPKTFTVRPNAGVRAAFQKRLDALIKEMHADLRAAILAQYKVRSPVIAQDASPASELDLLLRFLSHKWKNRFSRLSAEMARHFAEDVNERSDEALARALRRGGFSVQLRMTRQQRDILTAVIAENVQLIRSIGSEHMTQVGGLVMRSVQAGRDLSIVTKGLEHRLGVTRRRAALIAQHQNNMATAVLHRSRQTELGLQAIWLHSAGGKVPRPTHVANSGKMYDPAVGWFDPEVQRRIWPGELIRCGCVSKTIIPGLTRRGGSGQRVMAA
jgi:uncharacterized protein with gpF-like domain